MKKIQFLFICIFCFATAFAQQETTHKKQALGISFFLNDFKTAANIRTNGLVSVLKDKSFFKPSIMNPGIAVDYFSGISKHVDFIATLGGSFLDYPIDNVPAFNANNFLLETTANLNLKLLTDKYWVVPFIDLGVGASNYQKYFSAFTPVGIGLQVNFLDEAYLILNSQYRIPVTENASYHFYHSITIAGNIASNKVIVPKAVEVPVVVDRDGDGIVDSLDACPDQAGTTALQGCPDKDGDGIADKDDKCPDVAGTAKYNGCPIPDTDKDGINDEEDKCPTVAGVARYQGCPVPDKDNDGVNDEEDKCPNEAGPASNFGCPVIDVVVVEKVNKAAKNIFFATGSSKLLAKSYKSLKDVAQILKDNPSYKIDVDGYTDITGSADKNQTLSENRANSVKQYLIANGVDESRITATGHGINDPIADNKTAAGRSKNRRVEMKLRNY
ncbi:OmpA family protein [Ginsengibacter hankyongi]|uniref:OmpA family protein n=1 Tax=Ginsengibacter hankyongi TaxID=2607284 RepID=A0A5J5INT7_9BACT|nr:OmpA family protein [Ginsengibacter hankyongi]KAA9041162.1 OmpA family protein [Ginsengibacter hankyongi]